MRFEGVGALEPAVVAGVFTLAGATLGFVGAIAVEYVRGRSSTNRAAANRRERFQVETLTRVQDVAKDIFEAVLDTRYLYERRSEVPPDGDERSLALRTSELRQEADARELLLKRSIELTLLISRVHNEEFRGLADDLQGFAVLATAYATPEEDAVKAMEIAKKIYRQLQETAGAEILGTLDGKAR
jgi:hypothetical protein